MFWKLLYLKTSLPQNNFNISATEETLPKYKLKVYRRMEDIKLQPITYSKFLSKLFDCYVQKLWQSLEGVSARLKKMLAPSTEKSQSYKQDKLCQLLVHYFRQALLKLWWCLPLQPNLGSLTTLFKKKFDNVNHKQ